VATSTNMLTLTRPTTGPRRLLIVGGGIILAAAMVGVGAVAATLADPQGEPFAGGRTGMDHEQLAQHVLRENGAVLGLHAAAPDENSTLRQHVLREYGAAASDGSDLHQHVLRENAAAPSL